MLAPFPRTSWPALLLALARFGERLAPLIGNAVHLIALLRLYPHPAAVRQELQRRVHSAGAWRIEAASAALQLLDHLVSVFGSLLQQVQQCVLEVPAAKHARAWTESRSKWAAWSEGTTGA